MPPPPLDRTPLDPYHPGVLGPFYRILNGISTWLLHFVLKKFDRCHQQLNDILMILLRTRRQNDNCWLERKLLRVLMSRRTEKSSFLGWTASSLWVPSLFAGNKIPHYEMVHKYIYFSGSSSTKCTIEHLK